MTASLLCKVRNPQQKIFTNTLRNRCLIYNAQKLSVLTVKLISKKALASTLTILRVSKLSCNFHVMTLCLFVSIPYGVPFLDFVCLIS